MNFMLNLAEFWKQKLRSSTSTFLINHLNLQTQRLFYTGNCMKHYMIFIKLASDPKGRKENLLYISFDMFLWVHRACATMQTNQIHTIPPEPILSHSVYELLQFFLCKETIKCQKTNFVCLFVWKAAVFKLLISVLLFFSQNIL